MERSTDAGFPRSRGESCAAAERLEAAAAPGAGAGDGSALERLARATRQVLAFDAAADLLAAAPRLARWVHPSRAAAVVRIGWYGQLELVARDGPALDVPLASVARLLGDAAEAGCGDCEGGTPGLLLVRLTDGVERWALALHGGPAHAPPCGAGPDPLALLVSALDAALARARTTQALRQAAARDAAVLDAVREGVLRVDREGVIEALNHSAAAVIGVCRDEALGRRLRDFPVLAELRSALAGAAGQLTEFVQFRVRDGEVVVRAQTYEGGAVVTLLEVVAGGAAAQRTVGSAPRHRFEDLVGRAPSFVRVLEEARRAARADAPVLIRGESGTGKEMLAQAMHNASARAGAPFVGVNVTAIPRELLESELFGYEGGAFTGAHSSGRAGKFELAGRGTLLLDEIGDMAPELQAKLLRVLQERVVQRLGGSRDVPVRARIVATTHRDLGQGVASGRFRLDLLHRLRVVEVQLPALREHREDIPLLVDHQLRAHARATGRSVAVAPALLAALQEHDWPGNVRELHNVIEAELALLGPGVAVLERIPPALQGRPARPAADDVLSLEALERRACAEALAAFRGNVARAAEALGVAKNTLYAKIRRYGLAAAPAAAGQPC